MPELRSSAYGVSRGDGWHTRAGARRRNARGGDVEARAGGAHRGGADLETLARVVGRVRTNIEKVIEGKADVVQATMVVLLAEGHLLIEDVPGVGKTMLSKSLARSIDCSVRRIQFTPGPAAVRRHRRLGLQPEHPRVRVPARRRVRQHRGRRRDQPRLAQDPVRAARVHGGAPGHRRQHDLRARPAVHGHRQPEPDRDGGHLRPPRGTARPLHGAGVGRLPGRGRRDRDARLAHQQQPARRPRAGDRRRRDRQAHRHRPAGPRRRGRCSGTPSR